MWICRALYGAICLAILGETPIIQFLPNIVWNMSLLPEIRINPLLLCACLATIGLTACTAPTPGAEFNDPYEARNRAIYNNSLVADRYLLRPAGQLAAVTPEIITTPVANFADNVGLPGMVANGILQGDIDGVAINTMRFVVNTTVGIGGLFDFAGVIGLTEETTDFGETLSVWGFDEGAYVVLPVFGPSTERDAVGRFVDLFLDPLQSVGTATQLSYSTGARIADIAITRGTFMDTIDEMLYESADGYAQARLAYLQNRRFQLGEAPPAASEIDPFAGDLSLEGFE